MTYSLPIPEYAEIFTTGEFIENILTGMISDYDGSSHAIKNGLMSNSYIPCNVKVIDQLSREGVTHIAWFNK